MSWINDLASGLGIPAGAATVAVAMYMACAAAEKAAKPEALRDIGRILKDSSWSNLVRPSAIIHRIFNWTFGERHLSWKCLRRSAFVSLSFVLAVTIILEFELQIDLFRRFPFSQTVAELGGMNFILGACVGLIVTSVVPDFICLLKTRILLGFVQSISPWVLILCDITLSYLVSAMFMLVIANGLGIYDAIAEDYDMTADDLIDHARMTIASIVGNSEWLLGLGDAGPTLYAVILLSSLFTSTWMFLTLLSTSVIKLLAPLQLFTSWFFNVDEHPVKAIGIVSAALVMISSLVWTILRSII